MPFYTELTPRLLDKIYNEINKINLSSPEDYLHIEDSAEETVITHNIDIDIPIKELLISKNIDVTNFVLENWKYTIMDFNSIILTNITTNEEVFSEIDLSSMLRSNLNGS